MILNTGYVSIDIESCLSASRTARIRTAVETHLPGGWSVSMTPVHDLSSTRLFLGFTNGPRAAPTFDPTNNVITVMLSDDVTDERIGYVTYAALEAIRQEVGVFTLHGSAVAFLSDSRGILLFGEKGAGKTNTLLSLIDEHGAVAVGDDVIAIAHNRSGYLDVLPSKQAACIRNSSGVGGFHFDVKEIKILPTISSLDCPIPVSVLVRLNVHSGSPSIAVEQVRPLALERLRFHENTLRFVSGLATPVQLSDSCVFGPVYRIDTEAAAMARSRFVDVLLSVRFLRIQAPTAREAARIIAEHLQEINQ